MNRFRAMLAWLLAFGLAIAMIVPGTAIADDDDDWDDDDGGGVVTTYDDGDDWEDDGGSWDDDGGGDDGTWTGGAAPATTADDDGEFDDDGRDDDDDDGSDDDDRDDDGRDDAGRDDGDSGRDRPRRNQVVLRLIDDIDPYAFADGYGFTVLRLLPEQNMLLAELNPDRNDQDELNELRDDDDVEWGELNYTNQAPEGRPRYFFTSNNGDGSQLVPEPRLPDELSFSPDTTACTTGTTVVVAVLDTGVDGAHPALAANVLPNGVNMVEDSYDVRDLGNGVDDDNDGQVDEMMGHGTHVAGTILQVAPGAQILPVKVLDSDGVGDAFTVAAGIYYAIEQGAQVINLSLSSTYDSRAVKAAVEHAESQGVIVVAAAGNGNRSEPAEYPAATTPVISVAATSAEGDKADYSNYHASVDLSAPGNNVASAYPDARYVTASGTSMAVPIVSGTVALLLEQQPDRAPAAIVSHLQATSGPLNLSDPSFNGMLGAGILDIDASVACAG